MITLRAQTGMTALQARAAFRALQPRSRFLRFGPVAALLFRLTEAGGDPGIFCYRMGVDILSAGSPRFLAPVQRLANGAELAARRNLARSKRIQIACSTLFSTFSARFSTLKD